jgi:hypothetical protein
MIVEYERTLEDLVEFNLFHIAHSPSLQRQILLWRIFFALLTTFLSLGVIYLFDSDKNLTSFAYIISIIGGIVIFFMYPSLNRTNIIRRTRKLLSEGDNRAIIGHQTITVLPEGLFCKTSAGESRLNWIAIDKIVQNDDYIFLYTGAVNAIIIPKEAFPTDEAEQKFLDFIDAKYSEQNKTI